MKSLLLDRTAWDLCIDANRNIALAGDTYALAQDAACAVRLFKGEYIFNMTLGIPYFEQVLGKNPPINLVRRHQVNASLTVPEVVSAKVFYSDFVNGQLSGQVQVTNASGQTSVATF